MLARRLKELRFKNDITQAEFAQAIGVAQQTVGGWEKNYSSPSYELLNRIANYFNVTTDYLLGRDVKIPPPLSPEQRNLLNGFDELNEAGRNALIAVLNGLRATYPAHVAAV
ncbi:MAG: helix-turn-helix transcriptional regulator [Selenomonadaceae bacterium]|nr:helix-turn-helix transcriptional regulator [Selenomonadaceae bacterium]